MRLRITHDTRYDYQPAVETALHLLHLQPVDTPRQRVLDFALEVQHVGGSSARLVQRASAGGQLKLQCVSTLVWVTPQGRAAPWPEAIRRKMIAFMEASDGA